MPSPAKRQRLSTSDVYDNIPGIQEQRRRNELRLKSRFEAIYDKYDRDFTGIGDVIDMNTGQIVVDNGHLRGMRHERDLGVDKIGPKPVVKNTSLTKHRGPKRKKEIEQDLRKQGQDEHDELSSPAPRTIAPDVEDIPLILPAEGAWAKPEELNDPITQEPSAQPIDIDETAQLMSRIAAQLAPSSQGQIMLDSTSMAFIISEVTRGLQRQQNLTHVMAAPTPTTLPTPPASERAGPIKNFSSVWREEEEEGVEQSENEGQEGQTEAEEGLNAQHGGLEAPVTATRGRFQPVEDQELLRMKEEGLSYSDIAKQLTRHENTIRRRYSLLESKGYAHPNSVIASRLEMGKNRRTTINLPVTNDTLRQDERPGQILEKLRRRARQSLPSAAVSTTKSTAESSKTSRVTSHPIKRRSTRLSKNRAENSLPVTSPKHFVIDDSEGVEEPLEPEVDIQSPSHQTLPAQNRTNGKTRRRSGRPSVHSTEALSLTNSETSQPVASRLKIPASASIVDSCELQTNKGTVEAAPITQASPSIVEARNGQIDSSNGNRLRSQRFSHVEIVVNPLLSQAETELVLTIEDIATDIIAETDAMVQPGVDISVSRHKGRLGTKRLSDFRPRDEIGKPARRAGKAKVSATPIQPSSANRPQTKVPSVVIQDDLGSEDELGF